MVRQGKCSITSLTLMCLMSSVSVFRMKSWENVLSQASHLCIFIPMLLSTCVFRLLARVNVLSQTLHLCAFYIVWVSKCVCKFPAWGNVFPQALHLCAFCLACISTCAFRWWGKVNTVNKIFTTYCTIIKNNGNKFVQ